MKKFIIIVSVVVCLVILFDTCYYRLGFYIDFNPDKEVATFVKTDKEVICINKGNGYEKFEIKGVNMGSGEPGQWSTDFSIDKETYIKWFGQIKAMGANTIRIYTVQNDTFYNAFYQYNHNNPDPLYLLHGVWLNDYVLNSHRDAYDRDFFDTLMEDSRTVVDVLHGRKKLSLGRMAAAGHGTYNRDVSQWVIGYILGVEWEDVTVVFTDEKYKENDKYNSYSGKYMYTTEDASPFEALLAQLGDKVIEYETEKYKTQKLIAIGIAASRADARATKKQIRSAIEVLGITKDEIVDVLRVVLLTSGMPAFSKSLQILNSVVDAIEEEREDKA